MSGPGFNGGMVNARIPLSESSAASALATTIKTARHLLGWSQEELADRANTTKVAIWRLETENARVIDVIVVESVLKALGFQATLDLEGLHLLDRQRQVDAVHAWLSGYVARRLRKDGWTTVLEVMIPGEDRPKGWIDLLAFRESDGTLLVEETKTDLPDVGRLQRSVAFYEREARRAAAPLGWKVRRVVVVCVVLDSAMVAARITGARDLLATAFPGDVRDLRRWLRDATLPMPIGWCLAAADPASREHDWLRGTALTRRRRPVAYSGYAAAADVLRARSGEANLAR